MAVSCLDGVHHASFTFSRIRDLKNAETQDGDFNAII
jgi:hypothetical protein